MSADSPIVTAVTAEFRKLKGNAERALEQVSDEQMHAQIGPDANSLSVIIKHLAGNLESRFSDFLSSDGEKPWRQRDGEFTEDRPERAQLMQRWEKAWDVLFRVLGSLSDADLQRVVKIRGEPHTVFAAINRQTSHYGYHVGQIVLIAKLLVGPEKWKYLTIPRGQSQQFNQQMDKRFGK